VLNAGKEIEAMKRLTLHRIASSLHRFITLVAQLCYHEMVVDSRGVLALLELVVP
jgi:hypothetical protein